MHQTHYDMIVIGSGPAGRRAAIQAAKIGKQVLVVEKGRQAEIDRQINEEQFGDEVLAGFTSEESQSDINGQMEAMTDPSSAKQAVWSAGPSPAYGARENTVTPVEVGESKTQGYAAFVPGRGTIVSTSKQIVEDVIAAGASDTVLQAAKPSPSVSTVSVLTMRSFMAIPFGRFDRYVSGCAVWRYGVSPKGPQVGSLISPFNIDSV